MLPCCVCSSKHDGLAGTRFGWALVKDKDLAQRMIAIVNAITLAVSADIELRIINSMQTILGEEGTCAFLYCNVITLAQLWGSVIMDFFTSTNMVAVSFLGGLK